MNSSTAKKNRFADRVRAVKDFEPETAIQTTDDEAELAKEPTVVQAAVVATKNKTIELRLDTIATLKNAVNWQKLLGDGPQTEKDIIQEALAEWFRERDYPRRA